MRFRDTQTLIEQIGLLMASFIWTCIVLIGIIFFWAYQDVQARWEYVVNRPPEAVAQIATTPTATPTLWPGPGPTVTPTSTRPPTAVPTRVVDMPMVLPETLNPGETPIPVIVHTEEEAAEFGQQPQVNFLPSATPASSENGSGQRVSSALPTIGDRPGAVGAPTWLTINSVGIDSEIIPVGWSIIEKDGFDYSIWQVADYAVGWHKTSAALGQPGNTVMAGHHNVNGEVFRDLVNIEVGDRMTIRSGEQVFEYIVDLKTIVKEKGEPLEVRQRNAQWIAPTSDERITLVTCWPYTNNTHRVIVVAKPV